MNTIGGHERDVIRLGIQILALSDNATEYADQIERDHNSTGRIKAATRALIDPAKLVELLAEALRERGWNTYGDDVYDMPVFPCIDLTVEDDGVTVDVWRSMHDLESGRNEHRLTMPQARAALLRVLTLPEGATAQDALKALEVGR